MSVHQQNACVYVQRLDMPLASSDAFDISSTNKQGLSIDTVMPLFGTSVDMGISPPDGNFWVDPDMWNSDSDDPADSVCSILLEDSQSNSVNLDLDVPECNLNFSNMDDLFDFVGTSTGFDSLWVPAS